MFYVVMHRQRTKKKLFYRIADPIIFSLHFLIFAVKIACFLHDKKEPAYQLKKKNYLFAKKKNLKDCLLALK